MNDRIKKLAEQAGIKITPMVVDGVEYEYEDVEMDGSEDLAKFAELIVRECADIATYHYRRFEDGGKVIKERFGVE
jgi:hypothetical protein